MRNLKPRRETTWRKDKPRTQVFSDSGQGPLLHREVARNISPFLEVEEEKLTNLSHVVKDGNQTIVNRMSWAKEERRERISIAAVFYSSWVLGTIRALVPYGPHKGRGNGTSVY